ncbi:Rv2175c family DNA-binding protein [Jatrophihabitans fulvus]
MNPDVSDVLTFRDAAALLGVPVTRVHQWVREGRLVAVPSPDGKRGIPGWVLQDGAPLKALQQVVTLLRDARFDDDEIVAWLQREDDTLPGTPVDALRGNRGSEVKRRAQAEGF